MDGGYYMNYKDALSIYKNCPKCCSGRMEKLLERKNKDAADKVKKEEKPKN